MNDKLEFVEPSKYFWFVTGDCAKSLEELAMKIKHLDTGSFTHHVNEKKNDFAAWIHDVIGDDVLSKLLKYNMRKDNYVRLIDQRIKEMKSHKELPSIVEHMSRRRMHHIRELIKEINIKLNHHSDILDKYERIRKLYRKLDVNSKREIYPEITKIFERLHEVWNRINY